MRKSLLRLFLTVALLSSVAVHAAGDLGGDSLSAPASNAADVGESAIVSEWAIEGVSEGLPGSGKMSIGAAGPPAQGTPSGGEVASEVVSDWQIEAPVGNPANLPAGDETAASVASQEASSEKPFPDEYESEPEVVSEWDIETVPPTQAGSSGTEVRAGKLGEDPYDGEAEVVSDWAVETVSQPSTPTPDSAGSEQRQSEQRPVSLPETESTRAHSASDASATPSRQKTAPSEPDVVSDWQIEKVAPAEEVVVETESSPAPPKTSATEPSTRSSVAEELPPSDSVPQSESVAAGAGYGQSPTPHYSAPMMSYVPRPVVEVGPIIMLPDDPEARSSLIRARQSSLAEVLGWVAEVVDRYVPMPPKPLIEGDIYQIELNGQALFGVFGVRTAAGTMMLPLDALASRIGDVYNVDIEAEMVRYRRKVDGARFELNLSSGEVKANGSTVGFLPDVSQIDPIAAYFPANAVQVFAGLLLEHDDDAKVVTLKHDPRLQMITGFEVYLNGQLLPYLDPEPRAVGHVLLLPLRPIVEELGSRLRVEEGGNVVTVIRRQDNAEISLNLTTGLVLLEGTPQGTAPEISYADAQQLLIPREALASLTGTYVTLSQGSRRIDIDLDDELSKIIAPGGSLHERVSQSPPVLESVEVFTDTEHRASALLKGYYSRYNMELEYETPSTQGEDGFRADWVQLRTETITGTGLLLGDQSLSRREVQGVASGRVRGAYFYDPVESGLLVATLGQAHTGNEELDNGESVATFSGTVGGVRYYNNDGRFEAGIALREDEGYRALVASMHDSYVQPDFKLGALNQRLEVAAGLYDQGEGQDPGGQIHWDARLNPHERVTLSAMAGYTSEEVIRGLDPDTLSESYDDDLADAASYGLQSSFRLSNSASLSVGHNRRLRGVLAGGVGEDTPAWAESNSAGVSFRTGTQWYQPWTYLGVSRSTAEGQSATLTKQAQATWRRDAWSLLLRHDDRRIENEAHAWQTSAELAREPWIARLKRQARLSLSPRVNVWKPSDQIRLEAGALLSLTSGEWLGKRTSGTLTYARNLGISSVLDDDEADDDSTTVTGSDYLSASLSYRMNRLFRFDSRYFSDLGDYEDFYAAMTAFYEFNPPRRYRISKDDAGLLTGSVFLDSNADGIRQQDETGLPGARVVIGGTRVGLNTDNEGRFTIQNMPKGVYRVHADTSRLPLGYVAEAATVPPVRIGDAMITELQIPVMLGSQLTGTVYVDTDGDSEIDPEEPRLENIGLELDSGDESASTLFGQFAFDYLKPGEYRLQVQSDTLPDGVRLSPDANRIQLEAGLENHVNVRLLPAPED